LEWRYQWGGQDNRKRLNRVDHGRFKLGAFVTKRLQKFGVRLSSREGGSTRVTEPFGI
jgi:hypothetical protein